MEQRDRMRQKSHSALSAFTPRSSLVQRTCACGGVAGIDDLCEQCRSQRLSGQRGRNLTGPSWPAPLGHDTPSTSHQPIEATQQPSGGSRFGHDFSQIPIHATISEPIQAKLSISQPGDKYEQEADQIAEQVMRMPTWEILESPSISSSPQTPIQRVSPQTEVVRRQPEQEDEELNSEPMEEEEEALQAKEAPGQTPTVTPELDTYIHSLRGGGQPLPEATRAFMEPRFGHDFSQVRIHTDERAAETARAVNALAYTVGRDVVFGVGQYTPGTMTGQRLLAHELTHVVQQGEGISQVQKNTMNSAKSASLEQQADRMVQTVTEVATISPVQLPQLAGVATWLQRQPASGTMSASPLPICKGNTLEDFKQEIEKTAKQAEKDPAINIPKLYLVLKRTRTCFPPPVFDEAQFLSLSLPTKIYSDEMRKAVRGSYKGKVRNDDRKMIWAESKKPFAGYLLSGLEHAPHFTTRQRELGYTLTPSHKKAKEFADERAKAHKSFSEADVLVFSGHQYAQYKLPGVWYSQRQGALDLRNLPTLPNVKLVISTSCATLCREAAAIWKSLFPNAVFLGSRRSTPLEGDALAKEFVARLPKDLLLEAGGGGVPQVVNAWKSAIQQKYAGNTDIQLGWLDISSGKVEFWDGKKWGNIKADSIENACKVKYDYSAVRPVPPPL